MCVPQIVEGCDLSAYIEKVRRSSAISGRVKVPIRLTCVPYLSYFGPSDQIPIAIKHDSVIHFIFSPEPSHADIVLRCIKMNVDPARIMNNVPPPHANHKVTGRRSLLFENCKWDNNAEVPTSTVKFAVVTQQLFRRDVELKACMAKQPSWPPFCVFPSNIVTLTVSTTLVTIERYSIPSNSRLK